MLNDQHPLCTGRSLHLILYAHEGFLILSVLLWIGSLLSERRRWERGPLLLTIPLAAVVMISFISAIGAADVSLGLYQASRNLLHLFLYFLKVQQLIPWQWCVAALGTGLLLQSRVVYEQIWRQADIGWQRWGERELDVLTEGVSIIWGSDGFLSLRGYGLSDHPNVLGIHVALTLVLLIGWLRQSRSRWAPAGYLALTLGGATLFLTFYRPGWSAVAVAIGFLAWLEWELRSPTRPDSRWLLIITSLLVFIIPLYFPFQPYLQLGTRPVDIELRIQDKARQQALRQDLARLTNELAIDKAALGVGPGQLPLAMQAAQPHFPHHYQPPFNTILSVVVELGLFGGLFYVVALLTPWLILLGRRQITMTGPLLAAYGLLAALLLLGLFDAYLWSFAAGRVWQMLGWGLWAMAYLAATAQSDNSSQRQ